MIAGVTCHFNFAGFKRPVYNLRRFVRQMERDGLPLYGIELVLENQPAVMQGHKNWRIIRCTEKSIMFQKELLLNMCAQSLPPEYDKVITLDADVWFDDSKWIEKTSKALDLHPVVQPFEYAYWLGERGEILKRKDSIGKTAMNVHWNSHPGFAMAFRRSFFKNCGLYPHAVIGHGDTITACGLLGIQIFGSMVKGIGSSQHENGILQDWWDDAHEFSRFTVKYLEGVNVFHEWHGHLKDRAYSQRPKYVEHLDVNRDLVNTADGVMAWSDKADPQMVKWVKDWFINRKEDGNDTSSPEAQPINMAIEEDLEPSACIITCHNYGRYLRRCLDSILSQTKKFSHIVVVNDASTDDTTSICEEYRLRGVKVIEGNWRDFTKARTVGFESIQRPRYVLFVDADNWIDPRYHESLMVAMEDPSVGVAYGRIHYVNDAEEPIGGDLAMEYSYRTLRHYNYADACSLMRVEAFIQAGGWPPTDLKGVTDWMLWLKITQNGWKLKLCPQAVLNYRRHQNNMSRVRTNKGNDIQANTEVFRNTTPVCIVTLFSGRLWNLARFSKSLELLQWPRENIHLVAIDNSCDEKFNLRLHQSLANRGVPHTIVVDDSRVSGEMSASDFSDDANARTGSAYRLSEHLATLYAKAKGHIPLRADFVFCIEDDIEVPPDSLIQFMGDLIRNRRKNVGAISGAVVNRFKDQQLLAISGDWREYEASERFTQLSVPPPEGETKELMASGLMATLFRREVWDSLAFRPAPMWNDRRPYYDWAVGREINRMGYLWLLSGSVRCKHWQADGTAKEVKENDSVSQLNQLASLTS